MTDEARRKALDDATRWFARLRRDAVSARDRAAFEAWLSESLAHRRAYREVEKLWNLMDGLEPVPVKRPVRVSARLPRLAGALVASLLVLVMGLYVAGSLYDFGPWGMPHYKTAIGERRTVTLSDGTVVHLNSRSDIAVAFYDVERHVRLRAGEALFDVRADPERPFIVDAGAGRIRVTGTAFDVRLDGETADVAVIRGHVEVLRRSDERPRAEARLSAGEGVRVDPGGVSETTPVDVAAVTAWRQGRLIYRGVPLSRVIDDLNRYFTPAVRIGDASLEDLRLTAVIRLEDRDSILQALKTTLPVTVVTLPNGLTVLYDRRPTADE